MKKKIYTNPNEISNPYLNARKEWMERYGDYVKSANNWRLATLAMTIVSGIALAAYAIKSNEQTITPYIIQTNNVGEVTRLVKADIASKPNASHIRAALRNWLIGARTVYVDMRAEKDIITQTYAMTLPNSPAFQVLSEYHQNNDPFRRAQKETVEVQVNAVVPISLETWQVEWTETIRARTGEELNKKLWQAALTITFASPKTEEQIISNPIGIFVRQFAWTSRIEK